MIKFKNGLILSIVFCIVCFGASCFLSYKTRDTVLDSDASSEMILSKHLSETNQILSKEWYYSTELRVVNTQLIYSLIFKLTDNWGMVRFISSVIFRIILLTAYFYFMSQTGIKLKNIFYSAGLMMLPFSTAYGRIILMHSYYIPHTVFGFLTLGMFLQIFTCKARISKSVLCALLIITAFLGCLGGMRYLVIIYLPLILVSFFQVLRIREFSTISFPIFKDQKRTFYDIFHKREIKAFALSILMLCAGFAGYVCNAKILDNIYTFSDYSSTIIVKLTPDIFSLVWGEMYEAIGFNSEMNLMSITGIISVLMIFVLFFLIFRSINLIKQINRRRGTGEIIPLFFLSSFAVTFLVMLFTKVCFSTYYIPVFIYIFPLIALMLDICHENNWFLKKVFSIMVVCIIVCSSIISARYILRRPGESPMVFGGISYKRIDQTDRLKSVVSFLNANGYNIGLGTFWNANVITEITDGQIEMAPIEMKGNEYIKLYEWLTFKKYQNTSYYSDKKVFLILDNAEMDALYPVISKHYVINRVYQDNDFSVYVFE